MSANRFAIVHDWLWSLRGGEYVLENILSITGNCDIYTLFYKKGAVSPLIDKSKVHVSFLGHLPFTRKYYRHLLPLMPIAIEAFDMTGYNVIISSNHCVAKGIIPSPDAVHICYINTPMRYIWDQSYIYFKNLNSLRIKSIMRNFFLNRLRVWDITSANRVDYFISNSNFIKKRVMKFYKRESTVIHPPCDTEYFGDIMHEKKDFYLMVCALNQYKRVDIAIRCFNRSKERLIIVGDGPLYGPLKKMAGNNIEFYRKVDRERLRGLYQSAKAFIQVSKEDFGIATVEAQAALTPVAAYKEGGASETIRDGQTGILFDEQCPGSLKHALDKIKTTNIKDEDLRSNSDRFSKKEFRNRFVSFLKERDINLNLDA